MQLQKFLKTPASSILIQINEINYFIGDCVTFVMSCFGGVQLESNFLNDSNKRYNHSMANGISNEFLFQSSASRYYLQPIQFQLCNIWSESIIAF